MAEISDSTQVLRWVELGPERAPVTVETAWAQGDRDELCLSVTLFDPAHFAVSQHALDCEPVPGMTKPGCDDLDAFREVCPDTPVGL